MSTASQTLAELDRRMDILLEQINRADRALEEIWMQREEGVAEAVFGWAGDVEQDGDFDYESICSSDDEDDDSVVTIPYYAIPNYDSDSDTETVVDEWLDVYSTPTK